MMIGHQDIYQLFSDMNKQGTLSHAYLLFGPRHVGKRTFTDHIASLLIDQPVEKISMHPDVRIIERQRNEKTGKLKKDISVEQIREIRSFVASGPVMAVHTILIIDGGEYLSKSAANSLLKILEEPHSKACLFVLVPDPNMMLDTLVSRCQQFALASLQDMELSQACQDTWGDHPDFDAIIDAATGLPGKAITWFTQSELWGAYQEHISLLISLLGKPLHEKRQLISFLFEKKDDHISGREDILTVLRDWEMVLRSVILRKQEMIGLAPIQIVTIYDTLQTVQGLIRKNVHPRAVLDSLLLTIP